MLPTQVSYWANKEQARHNRAMEALEYGNLGVAQSNAATNKMNAETNQRNALTNVENAQINAINAETNRTNAFTNIRQADIQNRSVDNQYEVGMAQAAASASQAKSAARQATVAEDRATADIKYTGSKTEYQEKENAWFTPTRVAQIAETGTRALRNVGISLDTIASGTRSVLSNLSYHLRN